MDGKTEHSKKFSTFWTLSIPDPVQRQLGLAPPTTWKRWLAARRLMVVNIGKPFLTFLPGMPWLPLIRFLISRRPDRIFTFLLSPKHNPFLSSVLFDLLRLERSTFLPNPTSLRSVIAHPTILQLSSHYPEESASHLSLRHFERSQPRKPHLSLDDFDDILRSPTISIKYSCFTK